MSHVSILYQFQYQEYACLIPTKNQSLIKYQDKVSVKVFKRLCQGCFLKIWKFWAIFFAKNLLYESHPFFWLLQGEISLPKKLLEPIPRLGWYELPRYQRIFRELLMRLHKELFRRILKDYLKAYLGQRILNNYLKSCIRCT